MSATRSDLAELPGREYAYGSVTASETDLAPKGRIEEVILLISAKKDEPDWLLDWHLSAYRHWRTLSEPTWQNVAFDPIDDDIIYCAAPEATMTPGSLEEVDPELRAMFDKLGISLAEQERLSGEAVDAVVDSVSVATTFQGRLAEAPQKISELPGIVEADVERVWEPPWDLSRISEAARLQLGMWCRPPVSVLIEARHSRRKGAHR